MASWGLYDLRCEYKKNPIGLDVRQPRFSWKLKSEARGAMQTAYQVQVSRDPSFAERLAWDSGRVESDRSVHVAYEGEALSPRTRYWYRVRAWNESGVESGWSEPAYWETGLMGPEGWKAEWITAKLETSGSEGEDPSPYLRTSFQLRGKPVSARIYATAHGLYRLYVNGAAADDTRLAPGWTSYGKRLQYQTYEVTALLTEGENALGVILGNGWYTGYLAWNDRRKIYGDERALLLQLHVTYPDGSEDVLVTGSDGTWKASQGPVRMSEIYHGETYDARLERDGWASAGFDDSTWIPVETRPFPKDVLVAQENEPMRIVQELQPVKTLVTPKGELVLDMGQNMVGWMRFTVNAPAGTVVRLQHAEVLDREGNFYTENLRLARQTIAYVCKGGGDETYEPHFTFQGFRYVKVEGISEAEVAGRFIGCVVHSDLEQAGRFESSDPLLNQLYSNIVWGQQGNFVDVPTDCPQRDERLGWTGDAQVFIRTSTYQMNVAPFFTKWLRDLAADQLPNGGVPYVIPAIPPEAWGDPNNSHSSAAWGDAAVICPWTMYEAYADKRLLEEQYPSMKAWVAYIRSQGDNEYLWNTGFHYGDWLALDGKEGSYFGQTPRDLIATAFYAYSTQLVARAAEVLGYAEEAAAYRELHQKVVENFRKEFVSPNGRVIAPTQTAYVLALMFDLLEEPHRERAAAILASLIEENGCKLTTGFVGTPYLCPVLSRFGYTDLAYKLVMQKEYPSWLYSVIQGATTIWEHWDGIKPDGTFWSEAMNSFNHYAYGSIGEWLFRVSAGIDTVEGHPGYKRFRIAPQPGEPLTRVRAEYESMYGTIRSAWEKSEDGSRVVIEVTVPPNTEAEIVLPGARVGEITESGAALEAVAGVRSVESIHTGVRLKVGSGNYRFEYII